MGAFKKRRASKGLFKALGRSHGLIRVGGLTETGLRVSMRKVKYRGEGMEYRQRVLITAPYMHREKDKILSMLKNYPHFEVTWMPVAERLEEADLLPIIGGYEGILCGDDRITQRVIDAAHCLRVIVKWGTGIDSIDKEYAESRGIRVFRTPNAFSEPVADSTLAKMLNEVRGIARNDRVVKSGAWDKPQGHTLRERVVGIIGFGDVGRAVAKRLIPFAPMVLVNDIREIDEQILLDHHVTRATLEEILEQCDIITLHCDLNPTSRYILNQGTFSRMKKRPYVINTARGPLIKEADLVAALQGGQISGAGLDVFEVEPLPLDSPLRFMQNVTASCHNTNSSPWCWDKVHQNSLAMMAEGLGK